MNEKKEKEYKFSGVILRCTYNTEDFKVYAVDVDKKQYPDIKYTKYGNVTILGELPDLTIDEQYEIIAEERIDKYGYGYKVKNIKRNIPTSVEGMYKFLQEILTPNQATTLYENYPDIVQRVKENRLDDIDFDKLHGIKEYTFEKIKEKIIQNFCLADLVAEFKGYLNLTVIKKLYDKYTSIEVIKNKLAQDPYKCLCGLSGIGFKKADGILLEIERVSKENIEKGEDPIFIFEHDLKTSPERCLACVKYLLEENENEGHTKMNLADLRTACIKLVPACSEYFVDALRNKDIYYNKQNMDVSLRETYELEYEIAKVFLKYLNKVLTIDMIWYYDVEKYRNINGTILSDEQIQAVKNVCLYPFSILNGAAGTGKSFSTQAVIKMLKDNRKSFVLLSPTGKAAKVLKSYTKESASTIHRGLCYNPGGHCFSVINENNQVIEYHSNWGYNKYNKIKTDIVIVDEFSMVDVRLFGHLVDAIDFNTTKLLMIGDNAQLPSVASGNLLHDFMESKLIPTTTLTKVFRYGEGGLMKIATDVRFCKSYLSSSMKSKMTAFGDNKDYTFVDLSSEDIPQNAVALYKRLLSMGSSIENIQVLTAKNVGKCGTVVLNNMIQQIANPNYDSNINIKFGEATYYEGDLIIQRTNNYKALLDERYVTTEEIELERITGKPSTAFIANGESGIIKEIYDTYMIIDFDGVKVKYYKTDLKDISLGYAITIHKSQGSSIDNVILCTPSSDAFMLNSNILYVGLTRMRNKCYHLGTLNSVNQAIKKKANLSRNTFMQELLKTIPEEEYNREESKFKTLEDVIEQNKDENITPFEIDDDTLPF